MSRFTAGFTSAIIAAIWGVSFRAASMNAEVLRADLAAGKSVSASGADVHLVITASSDHASAGQEIGVVADVSVAPGWDIYATEQLPPGYTPTTIAFDADLVAKQSFEFPQPRKVAFPEIGETMPVYAGRFSAKGKVLLRSELKPGDYAMKGSFNFQECSHQICKLPQSIAFEMPLKIDPAPPSTAK